MSFLLLFIALLVAILIRDIWVRYRNARYTNIDLYTKQNSKAAFSDSDGDMSILLSGGHEIRIIDGCKFDTRIEKEINSD